MRWMPGDPDPWFGKAPARPQRPSTQLAAARAQFQAALEGLAGERIEELTRSIHRSRSLRDLWHLRTWIYTEVARAFSQFEAERRLDVINVFLHTHAGMSLRAMNESATQH
ncbi:hypothetical protein [Roseateles koreensis]|uniref:Uncharacterized protein n=1 Tax=Roseateles koreensis TaxID=2987526 RepID=A0ABT5KVE5_9BURK|nr:hypothetical protein [Roseateles koreensis]MDC8786915.1 hypothetical protein [Roseateles koreensis]